MADEPTTTESLAELDRALADLSYAGSHSHWAMAWALVEASAALVRRTDPGLVGGERAAIEVEVERMRTAVDRHELVEVGRRAERLQRRVTRLLAGLGNAGPRPAPA
jgi:hypothetical protein